MQLFNIILLLLLIHTIVYVIRGGRSQILSCGLFSYISSPEHSTFSWDKFNHLGLDNDERGGDSIGRVVGETVVKHVNNKKAKTTYQEYVIDHKNGDPSHIAIGHTRKASVGVISEATAQPVVLDLPDNQGGRFIMVHNGTLHNHEALADKHGVTKLGKSDSMILAEIIMNHGTAVLKEYEGAAALIWRDDRFPNTLFVFKGESLGFNSKLSEERPLYYYQETDDSMYISSRPDGLYFIGGDVDNVFDFDTNTLYEIYEGVIISETVIDRTKCSQVKKWEPVTPTYTKKRYNGYNESDYAYSQASFYENGGWDNDWDTESTTVNDFRRLPKIFEEGVVMFNTDYQIVFGQLRYWFWKKDDKLVNNKHLADGIYELDEFGYKKIPGSSTVCRPYFFFNGIMLKNKSAYKTVNKMFRNKTYIDSYQNNKVVSKYSTYPICSINNIKIQNTVWTSASNGIEVAQYFSGIIKPLFSYYEYTFCNGDLTVRKSLGEKTKPSKETAIIMPYQAKMTVVSGLIKHSHSLPPSSAIVLPQNFSTVEKPKDPVRIITAANIDSIYETEKMPFDAEIKPTPIESKEEEEAVDPLVQKEINDVMSTIMMAFDACKSSLENTGDDSLALRTVVENLTKIEDVLYNNNQILQKKILLISYEDEF